MPAGVGTVQLASGTSGLRRWYRRGPTTSPAASPGSTQLGVRCADGPAGHLRRAPGLDRHARTGDARPAHLGHRPLQLPLHLLHAQGGLRARLRVPAARPGPDLRGDRPRLARAFVGLGVEKLRITGGEPLVRRDLPDLIAMLAAIRRPDGGAVDLTLTTNGSALRALAGPLADAGLRRVTVSLDSLDDAVFGAMNGIDFPVARVLDGIDAALEAGLAPVKVNMVVRRGINEASIVPMARWARETGRDPALHRVHGRRPLERLAARRGRPGRGARRRDRRGAGRSSRPTPTYRGEVAGRWRYLDGGGEFGVISSVTQPFCRDCTRARLSADGQALHVPVRGRRARPRGPSCATARRTTELAAFDRGRSGRAATTATRSCARAATRRRCRRSRCSRWAARGRATPLRPQACPQPADNSWMRATGSRAEFVDNRVDPSTRPARTVGLARRGRQERRNRDRIKDLRSAAGRFGRFVARRAWPSHHGRPRGSRPTGRDRHPGVDTPVGPTKSAGLGRLPPATRCLEARMPDPIDPTLDPSRPSRPSSSRPASPRSWPPSAPGRRSSPRSASSSARGSAASPTTSRTRSRSRSPSCPAGRPRPRPGTPAGCCSGRLGGRPVVDAPGPLPPVRGQRPGPRRPAGAAVPGARRADRRPDQRRRRPRPDLRPGHADGHARPHQPDRPDPAARARTPTSSARASRT